jgi:2-keto-4-pentenoate hydratase/2-oxohepta-3-ene-1,7-dioic acid hydratase in catechol pathway
MCFPEGCVSGPIAMVHFRRAALGGEFMARSIVRFTSGGAIRWGRLTQLPPNHATDTVTVAPLAVAAVTTSELLQVLRQDVREEADCPVSAQSLLSPITPDAQLICQGLNYRSHAEEAAHALRRRNLIFSKASSSLAGAFDPIVRPAQVELLDYEVEIGVLIGGHLDRMRQLDSDTIGDVVAGVVLCNDVSARDAMFGAPFMQWYQGKSYRGFCPCGPVLTLLTRDEVAPTLANLQIELSVNGEQRQAADTSQLIFPPAPTLTELSAWLDLRPGDLLLTGTPGGVTASASVGFVEALRTHLFDDEARLDAIRHELTQGRPYLQPGDRITASLVDKRNGRLLSAHDATVKNPV